jgi:TolA-binding protein
MMKTAIAASSLVAALGTAPMQCRHAASEDAAHEESPGDALYALCEDFRAKGNETAAKETLRVLVEKYPSNRHAPAARAELAGATSAQVDAGR